MPLWKSYIDERVPCYKCNKRRLGCHSDCTEYIEFFKKWQEMSDKKREETEKRLDYYRRPFMKWWNKYGNKKR